MRIAFLNPHGNVTYDNCYLGENPDIGGQSLYVFEMAYALVRKGIKVDIFTRQIFDIDLPKLSKKEEVYLDGNLRIIRVPFGGKKFIRKELIWPYLKEYVNGVVGFYKKDKRMCDFISSHYGDGGISAAIINKRLKINYSFTAHSLGIQKIELLKNSNIDVFKKKYNIKTRIFAERQSMKSSLFNVVSTPDERYTKYSSSVYEGVIQVEDDDRFSLIAPGVNREIFSEVNLKCESLYLKDVLNSLKRDINKERRCLPYIISISRLDRTKNHEGLLKAYCECTELKENANLLIQIRGTNNAFKDYSEIDEDSKKIVEKILEYVKVYNLKGQVSLMNLSTQNHIAACFRYLSKFQSVFCLSSFYESFGLSYLEAMACGVPVVVTNKGGPLYTLEDKGEKYGVLIDPYDYNDIASKLYRLTSDKKIWEYYCSQGLKIIKRKYNWDITAKKYIKELDKKIMNGGIFKYRYN